MLIHWPGTYRLKPDNPKNIENRIRTYHALEQAYKEGKLKAIGVSNFTIPHLEHLIQHSNIKPMVNQVELHVLYPQSDLAKFCCVHGIVLQSYSTLGEGKLVTGEISVPAIQDLAHKYNKTQAQILLRWAIENGYPVIPKASSRERMMENLDVFDFELSEQV
jgi:diketogulonate reductase-like aldo/keto reductase